MHSTLRLVVVFAMGAIVGARLCTAAEVRFPTIPAHWVDNASGLEPLRGGEFTFDSVSFSSPTEGWIVGNRYILHIEGERLELQFLRSAGIWLNDVQASRSAGTFVAGSYRHGAAPGRGMLLRLSINGWDEQSVESTALNDWLVGTVRVNDLAGWASGIEIRGQGAKGLLWRRQEGIWKIDRVESAGGRLWSFARMCLEPSGDGWFVGSEWTEDRSQRHGLVTRLRGGEFYRVALPVLSGPESYVSPVTCLPGGRALAAAVVGVSGYGLKETGGYGILLSYDGSWQPIELPAHLHGYRVTIIAPVSDSDIWLVLWALHRPMKLVHWHAGRWDDVPVPVLPDGRTTGYSIDDMQFVSDSGGWGVGKDSEGPVRLRGLIFHYRDGVWRNRNWNWHFWHQRWFGLFGD